MSWKKNNMSVQYKLVINQGTKKILKEDLNQFKFKDLTKFASDIIGITTNTLKATIISVGAQVEYAIISTNVKGFASLSNINKKFGEKLDAAEKLYNDAIPESVKGDVDLLFNITNPGLFVSKRLMTAVTSKEGLDQYIPFLWFSKYLLSADFFKTDVENFGKLFGFKFNNIIWFKGWIYKDLIIDNINFIKDSINSGVLTKTNIEALKNIQTLDQLTQKYTSVAVFFRVFKVVEAFASPITEFYEFCHKWTPVTYYEMISDVTNYEFAVKELKDLETNNRDGSNKLAIENQKIKIKKLQEIKDKNLGEFLKDMKNSAATIFKHELELLPNVVKIFVGEDSYENIVKPAMKSGLMSLLYIFGSVLNVPIDTLNGWIEKVNTVLKLLPLPTSVSIEIPKIPRIPDGSTQTSSENNPTPPTQSTQTQQPTQVQQPQRRNTSTNRTQTSTPPPPPQPQLTPQPSRRSSIEQKPENTRNNGDDSDYVEESAILVLKNNQKFLTEVTNTEQQNEEESNISQSSLTDLKEFKLDKFMPNDAEELIIRNLIDDKKVSKYTKQWIEFTKLTTQVRNKNFQAQAELFNKMLDFSLKYFDNIQSDLQNALQSLNDNKSDESKLIESELNKKFKFNMTPQGFAEKISFDFELMCNLNRTYAGSYLTNIKFIFDQNKIIYSFLKKQNLDDLELSINALQNEVTKKSDFILNDEKVNKKFETINKEVIKLFDENSRTFEDFKKAKDDLFKTIEDNKKNILSFCEKLRNNIKELRKVNEAELLPLLIVLIDEFVITNQKNIDEIYNIFLPKLKELKNTFDVVLKNKKDIIKKNFDQILVRMDLRSVDVIYQENRDLFIKIFDDCIKQIGTNKESGPFYKNIKELETVKKQYEEKLQELQNQTKQAEKPQIEDDKDEITQNSSKKEKAALKINNDIKMINPIPIEEE